MILAHVDTSHHCLVVEQVFCQCLGKLCLTYTSCAKEYERGNRTLRVLQACTRTSHGIAHSLDGLILTNDTLVEFLLKMKEFLALALHHSGNRYSGPAAYNLGYIVGCHLLANHGVAVLCRLKLVLDILDVLLKSLESAIANLSHALVVAFALGTLSLKLKLLHLLLVLLNLVHQTLLALPLCTE